MAIHLFATEADLATVRRLSVRSAIGTTAKRKLADGSRRVWNQVAYEGEWLGHGAGEFEFTREVFDQIVANFERRSDPLPLTYGHPDGETASYMGAAGWIHALKLGTDDEGRLGLFAEMEFTERAAGQVNNGEQRHCSVVVTFEGIDEKTGEPVGAELYEVGLVLSAFIDGMRPLAAGRSRRRTSPAHGGTPTQERSLAMDAKDLIEKVGEELPDGADYEQLLALLEAEHKKQQALEGESDDAPDEEPPAEGGDEPPAMGKDGDDDEKVAASAEPEGDTIEAGAETVEAMDDMAYGPGAEAIVAEIVAGGGTADVAAVEAWLAENAADLAAQYQGAPQDGDEASDEAASEFGRKIEAQEITIESLQSKLSKESARANELQKRIDDQRDAELSKQVADAIECGAIREERRESLLKLGRQDRELFDDTLATAKEIAPPPGVPLKRRHTAAKPGADRSPKGSKREQIAALSSREKHFYEAQIACGKTHADALENAIAKARTRVAAN